MSLQRQQRYGARAAGFVDSRYRLPWAIKYRAHASPDFILDRGSAEEGLLLRETGQASDPDIEAHLKTASDRRECRGGYSPFDRHANSRLSFRSYRRRDHRLIRARNEYRQRSQAKIQGMIPVWSLSIPSLSPLVKDARSLPRWRDRINIIWVPEAARADAASPQPRLKRQRRRRVVTGITVVTVDASESTLSPRHSAD